jgi:deazaflavin-dependent oxidoreductase (nitroreductase family)
MSAATATPSPSSADARLRRLFKLFNPLMVLMWRLGWGPWLNAAPRILGRYLVLTHTGRKSGRVYHTPVNYATWDGALYVTAGFGAVSDWYRNLQANPTCEVWLPDGWYRATAEDVTGSERALPILREVLIASAFAARAAGLDPLTMGDDELRAATADYRLLRLLRLTPGPALTGGGPGDLAWVGWLAAVVALPVGLALGRRARTDGPTGPDYAMMDPIETVPLSKETPQ